MSVHVWVEGSALSHVCDQDVAKTCLSKDSSQSLSKPTPTPGKVLECLKKSIAGQQTSGSPQTAVDPKCKALIDIAEPPDDFDDYQKNLQVRCHGCRC
jgi:hypothetical protein